MKDLSGKTAVITGGASGIGRASALALAARGVKVVIGDLHEARGDELVAQIGDAARFVRCDVTREDDLTALRDTALSTFGAIHILMNNAGMLPVGALEDMPMEAWRQAFDVNFFSVVRATQLFLPQLKAAGEAHIVNTASAAGLMSYDPVTPAYNASKAAVVSLSEALAAGLRSYNIGVTCLCPGGVTTNIVEQIRPFGNPAGLGIFARQKIGHCTAEQVGERVAQAIQAGTFLLHTDDAVGKLLADRAANPDAFVSELAAIIAAG